MIVTRFAPSPTGYLHIGSIRTALFNWLYARHKGGKFRLRIEDTDKTRSTSEAVFSILTSLRWLGISWDEEVVFQSTRAVRHIEVAQRLLECGMAYRCYCTSEELEIMREASRIAGSSLSYDRRWRDRNPLDAPLGIRPTIRLRIHHSGETVINDLVQGKVRVRNDQLDDMILLRSNGTPTYIFSAVVDDYDMGVTHIIRGDDHLTNAFRQIQIYQALGWKTPIFAHIPLIHSQDGAKLSKRHGASKAEFYRNIGFLPESICNYLAHLGCGHKDTEIFTTEQAIIWFDIINISCNAARFDLTKLTYVNTCHLRKAENRRLVKLMIPYLETILGMPIDVLKLQRLHDAIHSLKVRAHTVTELAEMVLFYVRVRPLPINRVLLQQIDTNILITVAMYLSALSKKTWDGRELEDNIRMFVQNAGWVLGVVAQTLRVSLTGSTISPPIFEVMQILGREETLGRISDTISAIS